MQWSTNKDDFINGKEYIICDRSNTNLCIVKFIDTDEGYDEDDLYFIGADLYRYSNRESRYDPYCEYGLTTERWTSIDELKNKHEFTNDCDTLAHNRDYLVQLSDGSYDLAWYLDHRENDNNVYYKKEGFYFWNDTICQYIPSKKPVFKWIYITI